MTAVFKTPPPVFLHSGLERLQGQQPGGIQGEKARLRKATKEFESLFMYYMLKNMRKTVPQTPFGRETGLSGAAGKDVFTDLFDMEVARRVAANSDRSISGMLYKSLEKLIETDAQDPDPLAPVKSLLKEEPGGIDLRQDGPGLPTEVERFLGLPQVSTGLPVANGPPTEKADPILARYGRYIDQAARETKLDSALIASVIKVESNGDASAVSAAGAKGLMQLADTTAREMGVGDPFDPQANIRAGSRYLRRMLDRYGDLKLALAAYNAGPANVDKHQGVPPFAETRAYVTRVSKLFKDMITRLNRADTKVRPRGGR